MMLMRALADYEASLHTCGRPLSESLHDDRKPDQQYYELEYTCVACRHAHTRALERGDRKDSDPSTYTLRRLVTPAEWAEIAALQASP